jgi:tetratricopeptide (TPR) repeat protein
MRQYVLFSILIAALAIDIAGPAVAGEPTEGAGTATDARIEGDPTAARPLFQQGQTAYVQGQYAEAADLFRQAFEAWPHPAFAYNRGQSLLRASRWQDALTSFELYMSSYETSGLPRSEFDPLVYIQVAECQHRLGQADAARQSLQRYIEGNPQGALAPAVRQCVESGAAPSTIGARDPQTLAAARRLYDEAVALYQRGQYRQAAERFQQAYTQHSDITELLFNAAVSYRHARMWTEAVDVYQRYLQTPAAGAEALVGLALCYHEQAQYERAIDAYQRYLEREPNGEEAQDAREYVESMRAVLASRGQPPSQETIRRASQHFQRAVAHYTAQRYRQALQEFEQAQSITPARETQFNIAMCHYRMREWAQAITEFETYLRDGDTGSDALTHLHAAECLLAIERWADAQRHIEAYLARAEQAELPDEERDRARAQQLMQRVRQASGAGGSG